MENQDQTNLVKEISEPLYHSRGWMKFLGVLTIIYGVLLVFTIVGILIAWLPIWLGILIYKSASSIEDAYVTGDKNAITKSLNQLKIYFTIGGVLALIAVLFTILALAMGLLTSIYNLLQFQ